MIYIIGVNHSVQTYDGKVSKYFEEFEFFLRQKLAELNSIKAITEEFSEDALKHVHCASETIARKISKELSLKHLFVDPSLEEQKILGIKSDRDVILETPMSTSLDEIEKTKQKEQKRSNKLREEFWFEVLKKENCLERIVFICGAVHTESFFELLSNKSIKSEILEHYFMEDKFG